MAGQILVKGQFFRFHQRLPQVIKGRRLLPQQQQGRIQPVSCQQKPFFFQEQPYRPLRMSCQRDDPRMQAAQIKPLARFQIFQMVFRTRQPDMALDQRPIRPIGIHRFKSAVASDVIGMAMAVENQEFRIHPAFDKMP